jgi:hypothetical protein
MIIEGKAGKTGAIAGGCVAAIVFCVLVLLATIFFLR